MSLSFDYVSLLTPHERIIQSLAERLAGEIRGLGYVIHPIIADRRKHLIIDGTHRLAALKRLNLRLAPVYDIDYFSGDVRLKTWARFIHEPVKAEEVLGEGERLGLNCVRLSVRDLDLGMWMRGYSIVLITGGEVLEFRAGRVELDILMRLVDRLDEKFKGLGLEYVPEEHILHLIQEGGLESGYLIPRLEKEDVLNMAVRGIPLPPKTTRHTVNGRPMYIFCPLELLNHSIEEAEQEMRDWLRESRRLTLPGKTWLDRYYEEPVTVYFFERFRSYYPAHLLERGLLGS
ncbi:MAG: ParB N-terminal domain-containing protein [Nitrososphaerota archaeon]